MNKQNLFDTLKAKPVEELRDLARKSGLTPHHRAKPETLARQIVEATAPKPIQPQIHAAEMTEAQKKYIYDRRLKTEDEVRAVFNTWPKIQIQFNGDDTFTMSCNGSVETMHMTSKEAVMVLKGREVAKGAYRMVQMDSRGDKIMRAG